MITKLENYHKFTAGASPLPAGAIPLAGGPGGSLVCLMPAGRWVNFQAGVIKNLPPETQNEVMKVVLPLVGSTAQEAADKLGVSRRTVESWRSGQSKISVAAALRLAELLSS